MNKKIILGITFVFVLLVISGIVSATLISKVNKESNNEKIEENVVSQSTSSTCSAGGSCSNNVAAGGSCSNNVAAGGCNAGASQCAQNCGGSCGGNCGVKTCNCGN